MVWELKDKLGETAHQSSRNVCKIARHHKSALPLDDAQLIASFNFFIANTRTVLEAGLALKTHGSLVKGLTPLRAGVAGFFFNFMFIMPASLKAPFFFNCSEATPMMPSTTPFTCFCFKPVVSATDAYTADWVKAPLFIADFMDFIAGAMAENERSKMANER